ncbi:hypothetical protein FBD94_21250 [Pedobacter hiemivivus]|uniref:Uncharacterized protein n=1 Tax=Pedobacter hiemivivus TaxID=2530454 RepID=A0A4U1G3J7_9SPHI|nr:hypothetical protein [Pedobacter hiemivivus]TKC57160.1 hypothetical protein FBD94_21250 [Pedobacter hiemivivus]
MIPQKKLNELYDQLKKFHLSDALYVIGAVNAALKFGTSKPDRKNIPDWIWTWLQTRGRSDQNRRSLSIVLSRMARFLLLSSANDYRGVFLDLNNLEVRKAYSQVANLEELDDSLGDDISSQFSLYFNRIGQYQFPLQASKKTIIGRGFLLFHKLILATPSNYDFDVKFKEYFDLTLMEFMSTGFAMWILSNGTLDYEIKNEIKELTHVMTLKTQRIFLSLSCGTPKRYRELVRGSDWKTPHKLKDMYALDPLAIMPAVIVEKSSKLSFNTYVVPQAKYLLDRASSGIFYLLGDKEKELAENEEKKGKNPFRNAFGMVYRAYVGNHLSILGMHEFIDLDNDFVEYSGKLPDFAILQDEICILFEVKTSLLNIDARTYFEKQTLEREVNNGNIKKAIKQLMDFKNEILLGRIKDARFSKITSVIRIVVGYEDIFSINSTLLPLLDKISGSVLDDLQFASISDIEAIGSAIDQKINIITMIQKKVASPDERQWSIATLFDKDIDQKNSVLDNAFNEFIAKMGVPNFASKSI